MTNEMIGIIGVFVLTGILFLLRHLIVTAGKPRRKPSYTRASKAAKRSPRPVDSRDEKERERSYAESATSQVHPEAFPRFPI